LFYSYFQSSFAYVQSSFVLKWLNYAHSHERVLFEVTFTHLCRLNGISRLDRYGSDPLLYTSMAERPSTAMIIIISQPCATNRHDGRLKWINGLEDRITVFIRRVFGYVTWRAISKCPFNGPYTGGYYEHGEQHHTVCCTATPTQSSHSVLDQV